MFKRQENEKNKDIIANAQEDSSPRVSTLGPTFSFNGEISGNEDLLINGSFTGKINLRNHNLIIGKDGRIESDIQARDIHIHGKMKGNISASGKVYIAKDARVDGDISAFRISIMDGAQFKGSVKMMTSTQPRIIPEKSASSQP